MAQTTWWLPAIPDYKKVKSSTSIVFGQFSLFRQLLWSLTELHKCKNGPITHLPHGYINPTLLFQPWLAPLLLPDTSDLFCYFLDSIAWPILSPFRKEEGVDSWCAWLHLHVIQNSWQPLCGLSHLGNQKAQSPTSTVFVACSEQFWTLLEITALLYVASFDALW